MVPNRENRRSSLPKPSAIRRRGPEFMGLFETVFEGLRAAHGQIKSFGADSFGTRWISQSSPPTEGRIPREGPRRRSSAPATTIWAHIRRRKRRGGQRSLYDTTAPATHTVSAMPTVPYADHGGLLERDLGRLLLQGALQGLHHGHQANLGVDLDPGRPATTCWSIADSHVLDLRACGLCQPPSSSSSTNKRSRPSRHALARLARARATIWSCVPSASLDSRRPSP